MHFISASIRTGDSSSTENPSSVRSVEEGEGGAMGGSTANESKLKFQKCVVLICTGIF